MLPKGISSEAEMVAVLVGHYTRSGSVLRDVQISDDGRLDWTTQVAVCVFVL